MKTSIMSNADSLIFERLQKSKIELLRNWRNQYFVAEQMEYKSYISKEQQENWFSAISKSELDEYYIFGTEKEDIGLVHLAQINLQNKSAHVGLFIGNADFIGTGIAFQASIFILFHAFEELQLKTVFAKVKNTNLHAIKYNSILGFQFLKALNSEFGLYFLTVELYNEKKGFLKEIGI